MSAKELAARSKFMQLLSQWDRGSTQTRRQILLDFVYHNQNKTGTEIEEMLANSASLFLARITAWLRLTYMIGTCIAEQLEVLKIFLGASCSNKFLAEFMEVIYFIFIYFFYHFILFLCH